MSSGIAKSLQRNKKLLWNVSQEIWKHPELCFEEKFAHDLLTETLEKFDFLVQKQYILSTAFRAEFDSGKEGPTVAVICEYDALPSIGHACGHNLIAEIGLGTGIAVKEAMETDSTIKGKIVVLGTPAEEGGGGKIKLIENGAFDDIDAVMMAHPQAVNRLYPLIVESAFMKVTFKTNREIMNIWEDPSAVDASVACYNNVTLIRRSLNEQWRVSMIIRKSTHEESVVEFIYRAPSQSEICILKEKLELCIEAAAKTTDCVYMTNSIKETKNTYKGLLYNKAMTEVFGRYANAIGITFYDGDPRFVESAVSSDIGNVSQIVPAIQPEFEIGAIHPHVNHTPGFAEAAASEVAQEYTFAVMEALAKTAVELLSNPELMLKVKNEFDTNPLKDSVLNKLKRNTGE